MSEEKPRGARQRVRQAIKRAIDACCLVVVAPSAWMCRIEGARGGHRQAIFVFWAQAFALVPGVPGVFMRRAFYRLTLATCSGSFLIGFGAFFSHRNVIVEDGVYIGPYSIVGSCRLRQGCLIGSRVSIVSGKHLHELDNEGRWRAANLDRLQQVEIGEHAWIGEAALVMTDVGQSAMVAAGAVVPNPVAHHTLVAGNPARFVKHLGRQHDDQREAAVAALTSLCAPAGRR